MCNTLTAVLTRAFIEKQPQNATVTRLVFWSPELLQNHGNWFSYDVTM